jgi:O-antigen/teichoic acid export membrane protein
LTSTPSKTAFAEPGSRHIDSRAIRRGLALNLMGAVAPAVAAVFCIRVIAGGLGPARFGVLSLAWVFINAVGILDLGIGRALTRFLAVREEVDVRREAAVVWTSLATILAVGLCGGAAAYGFADALAVSLAHGDAALRIETASALRILALSVPSVMLSSGLRGALEAFGRFDLTNRVNIPITLLNLILPAVLLHVGASLLGIVSALVLLRIVGTLLLLASVLHVLPAMRTPQLRVSGMHSVLAYGGWVTVSHIPGPLFAQAERYFLGSLAALSAVAFYSTPAEILSRVTVIPGAVIQVLFPVLAQALQRDPLRAARLANRALLLIGAAVLPLLTVLVAVAPEALELWLGPEFAAQGARAGRMIALATFMDCMAWHAFSIVQSAGLARWTGKLRAVEIPLYLGLSAFLIHRRGIEGAALASLIRATADGAVLVSMATRVLGSRGRVGRLYVLLVTIGAVAMAGAAAPWSLLPRLAWSALALGAASAAAWRLLDREAREALSSRAAGAWARLGSVAS